MFFVSGKHGMSYVCEYFLRIRYDQGRAPDIALLYMDARLDGHRHTFEIEFAHALCVGGKKSCYSNECTLGMKKKLNCHFLLCGLCVEFVWSISLGIPTSHTPNTCTLWF